MKKKFVVPILLITLFLMLACIGGGDEETDEDRFMREWYEQGTLEAMNTEEAGSAPADATPEPEYQSVIPPSSDMSRVVVGSHEYSVNATNFECICQATGNLTTDFNFTGDQVEITVGSGEPTWVYDKIGDNKYQRSFMGYYILRSGEGDQVTETKVEEEKITVIILTSNGYVMEHYSGSSSSPCCYYTFTIEK